MDEVMVFLAGFVGGAMAVSLYVVFVTARHRDKMDADWLKQEYMRQQNWEKNHGRN